MSTALVRRLVVKFYALDTTDDDTTTFTEQASTNSHHIGLRRITVFSLPVTDQALV